MANSQHTKAFGLGLVNLLGGNLLGGSLLGGNLIGNIIGDLTGTSGILGAFKLGNIFDSLLGGSNILSSTGLGSVLGNLGVGNLFGSVKVNDIFNNLLGDLGSGSNSSASGILGDLSNVFGNLDLKHIFGGLDNNYYYIFNKLPVNDLVNGLGEVSGLTGAKGLNTQHLNVKNADVLDGFGTVLNMLGQTDVLKDFSIKDIITGNLKNDQLKGINGDDLIVGRQGSDRLFGLKGNDLLNGGAGNDYQEGGSGNDVLVGMAGNDTLLGGKGNDIIDGGAGNNTATGGKGNDQFLLEPKGNLVITDFNTNDDKLVTLGNTSFSDLTVSQQGNDTIVSLGGKQLATLQGINAGQITDKVFSTLASIH